MKFDTEKGYDTLTIGKGGMDAAIFTDRVAILELSSVLPSNIVAVIPEQMIWMTFDADYTANSAGFYLLISRSNSNGE